MTRNYGSEALGYLIGMAIVSFGISFFTVVAIFRGKQWQGRMRLFSVVPYSVGAAFPTIIFNLIRTSRNRHLPVLVRATYGLPSIAGIFAAVVSFLLVFFIHDMRKPKKGLQRPGSNTVRRRTSFFYLLTLDLAIIACLAVSAALSGRQVPWTFDSCDNDSNHNSPFVLGLEAEMTREIKYRRSPAAILEDRAIACNAAVGIQLISSAMAAHLALQSVLLCRIIALPTFIRFLLYSGIRLLRRRGLKLGDEELGATVHPATCTGEKKSQCWACDGVVCTDCKVKRGGIAAPRTTHHVTECYAVCTACYLTRWSSQPEAALSAALHPADLSKQHAECGLTKASRVMEVELCGPCSRRSADEVSGMRERREEVMLKRLLAKRIFCAKCEKPVPKNKARWWICGTGNHECHWRGHEPGR